MAAIQPGAGLPSVILSLVAVLGLLVLALLVGRWLQRSGWLPRGALTPRAEGSAIRLVSARGLGWQTSLHLLEVDGRRFLVGVGRSGVTALGTWQSPAGESRRAAAERPGDAAARPGTGA